MRRLAILSGLMGALALASASFAQTPAPTRPTAPTHRQTTAPAAAKPGEFQSEAQAKASCPGDTVVWVNTRSKIYHFATSKNYGHTKSGVYMCEKSTAAAGFRAAKNEKHP